MMAAAGCAVLGGCMYVSSHNEKSFVESFKDCFGGLTPDNIKAYFRAKGIAEASITLRTVEITSSDLASAARKIKAKYKFPVELTAAGTYKTYNRDGEIVEAAGIFDFIRLGIFNESSYYFVDSLDNYPFTVDTSGEYVVSQDVYNDLVNAVKSVTKKVVNVGKGVLSWLVDKTMVNAVDSVSSISDAYYDKFGDSYKAAMSSVHGDATTIFIDAYKIGISLHGILLELHTSSGVYFSTFTPERFETLNNSYKATGDISVFTNNMSTTYDLWNPHGFYGAVDNTNGGAFSGGDAFSTVSLSADNGVACIHTNIKSESALDRMSDSSKVHIVNNGNTANYVIGTVGADGTISYDVVGESTSIPYVDSILKGNERIEVNGDIVLNEQILSQLVDRNLTVEQVNKKVAAINESVTVVDESIKNGFESNNNWLSRIWSLLTGLPGLIASAFIGLFDTLFDWLRKILNGILDIPGKIVDGLVNVKDAVLSLPDAIAIAIEGMGDFFKGFFDGLLEGLLEVLKDILDLLDFLEDIFDLLGFLSDILDILRDVWDFIKSIPSRIIELLKDLLIFLFSPKDSFFNDWSNKFKSMLGQKLPYDTYNNFLSDVRDITKYRLDDIKITVCGTQVTILSFKIYYEYEDTIYEWIRGVMFLVLVFYNLNQIYKLIRGTSLYKIDKYLGK